MSLSYETIISYLNNSYSYGFTNAIEQIIVTENVAIMRPLINLKHPLTARVWEVGVFRHEHVVFLCRVCILWSLDNCVLHDLQFDNAGRGYKRRPYRRGIL